MAKSPSDSGAEKLPEEKQTRTKKPPPDPEHLAWSLDGRRQTQHAALRLYRLFLEKKLTGFKDEAQQLAAVAFSLWRAVFLADRTGNTDPKQEDATEFLAKMLTDNAITFAMDRECREWTFNYYIEDANFRLKKLYDDWEIKPKSLYPPTGQKTAQIRWNLAQGHFEALLTVLENKIEAKQAKKAASAKVT